MKNIYYCIILILIFLASCASDNKKNSLHSFIGKSKEIKGYSLKSDSTIWSNYIVTSIESENSIITRTFSQKFLYHYYHIDIKKNRIEEIGTFGKIGDGPKEFSKDNSCYYSQDKQIYLFSKNSNIIKCYKTNIAPIERLCDPKYWKEINLDCAKQRSSLYGEVLPMSDSLYLILGGNYEENNLLTLLDLKKNTVKKMGIPLPDDKNNSDLIVKQGVYSLADIQKRPNHNNQFLYCCSNWGNFAEIITLNDKYKLVSRKIVAGDFPLYTSSADGINVKSLDNTFMGMQSFVNEQFIYILPNFLTKKEYIRSLHEHDIYPPEYCYYIFQLDWNGNYINSYKLDQPIRQFYVDPTNQFIIGGGIDKRNGDICFLKFDLKQ